MFEPILYFVIIGSLTGLAILAFRKAPLLARLSEEEMLILSRRKGIIQKIQGANYKQHWLNFIVNLEKLLRKTKIIFLKIENILSRWIEKLRNRSQVVAQKSKEWMKYKEKKWRQRQDKDISKKAEEEIYVRVNKEERKVQPDEEDNLSISELKKPIKEEQKWIDLIVENPKNITAYKFLGLLYWKQHNYADAKASLEMAVRLGSRDKKVKEILEELKKISIK